MEKYIVDKFCESVEGLSLIFLMELGEYRGYGYPMLKLIITNGEFNQKF